MTQETTTYSITVTHCQNDELIESSQEVRELCADLLELEEVTGVEASEDETSLVEWLGIEC